MPPAIFRKFGTELLKVAYREGAAATVTTTWTLLEEGGKYAKHTIEAGTALRIVRAACRRVAVACDGNRRSCQDRVSRQVPRMCQR